MGTRAAIYLRQSLDASGEALAVSRQHANCLKIAKDRGWKVVEEYIDNSVSASNRKVRRPAYERMVKDYTEGRFEAIVCWDLDRLTRQPRQLEDWIDAAEERGLLLVTANGEADLSNDNGRLFARIKASVARSEIERKSARQRAANLQRSESGLPHAGRRTFGYSPDGTEIVPNEAEAFRRAVDRLLAGGAVHAIARSFNEDGLTTTAGNPWAASGIRSLLKNPRHAGLRVYRSEVVGKGTWPAIIDEETHHAVRALLSDPSRHKAGRPRRYLLTGVATCGTCGATVRGVTEPRGPLYYCQTRKHIARRAEDIDNLVHEFVIARLRQPNAVEIFARPQQKDKAADLRQEQSRLRTTLKGLAEAFADGDIDRAGLKAGSKRVNDRLEVVTTELADLTRTPILADLARSDDVATAWEQTDVDTQRTIVSELLHVTIHSPGRGARTFDPATVNLRWRE
ncbi:recombinase family protein [Ornithinimicrobium sp. LYQ92]|uniref:recombinase family protein n=1 Tax=Serinicoccus sp. LYQ92 TaxID=3378798 RepID=UPI0038527BA5